MPDTPSSDDNDTTSSTDPVETTPEAEPGRSAPRADPAQQFLTWAVLVLVVIAAVVFGLSLVDHEPDAPTGMPSAPLNERLR